MNWQDLPQYKQKVEDIKSIIDQYYGKESIAVTGTVGLGKTTFLRSLPYEVHKERNKNVTLNKGIVSLKDQREIIEENIKELMFTKNIFDRHALVDGYVFYCVSGEYLIDKYNQEGSCIDATIISEDMKLFKEWYWQWINDFVVHLDFKFNILFLTQGNTTNDELLNRISMRNRSRDDIEIMKRFVDRFEEFALRTLKEIRALGANINIIEYEINDNDTYGRLVESDAAEIRIQALRVGNNTEIVNKWMQKITCGDFLLDYADQLTTFRAAKNHATKYKNYAMRDKIMRDEWQFKRWFWSFMESVVPGYTHRLEFNIDEAGVNSNFDLRYAVRAFQNDELTIVVTK